jgi:hypothetical protein
MRGMAHMILLVFLSAISASFIVLTPVPFDLSGCTLDAAHPYDSERLKELRTLIDREIGTPRANQPSQCKLIGFGSKPCGGPWSYLVYSTRNTDEFRLRQLVSQFNQFQKKINQESKIYSTCTLTPVPEVHLINGICTAKPQ